MHMVSKKDLNSAELETMRTSRSPTAVMTANGEVQTRQEATENVKELDSLVTVMLLEETPAASSLGKLCEDHGFSEPAVKNHISPKMSRESIAIDQTVPFVVRGLSTSSSTTPTPTSSSSSSQDSVFDVKRYAENPVPERSGSTSEELRLWIRHARKFDRGCVQVITKRRSKVRFDELYQLLNCSLQCHFSKL